GDVLHELARDEVVDTGPRRELGTIAVDGEVHFGHEGEHPALMAAHFREAVDAEDRGSGTDESHPAAVFDPFAHGKWHRRCGTDGGLHREQHGREQHQATSLLRWPVRDGRSRAGATLLGGATSWLRACHSARTIDHGWIRLGRWRRSSWIETGTRSTCRAAPATHATSSALAAHPSVMSQRSGRSRNA